MDIKLYYIEGISRADTPYFSSKGVQATLARQKDYFDDHVVTTISTAFYPPHYTNVVKVDIEDVTFTDTVNYLSLEYNDKTYYYFIDDIEYVSESIIRLHITMDVIQTYMFNIRITNGIVERKFIDRWNDDNTINRNYIRENVSNNEFYTLSKEYINTNYKEYTAFLKQTKTDKSTSYDEIAPGTSIFYFNTNGNMSELFPSAVIPYNIKWFSGSEIGWKLSGSSNVSRLGNNIRTGSYLAETVDMYICPFNPFKGLTITPDTTTESIISSDVGTLTVEKINFDDMHGEDCYYFKNSFGLNLLIKSETISFVSLFHINALHGVNFDSKYILQLFDDNYLKLSFGTVSTSTTYPLYVLKYRTLYGKYAFDASNGSRIYFINETNLDDDKYNTVVIDTNILSIDLKNSKWAEYIANNKNRWAQLSNNNIANISKAGMASGSSFTSYGKIGKDISGGKAYTYGQVRDAKGRYTRGVKKLAVTDYKTSRDVYGRIPSEGNYNAIAGAAVDAGAGIIDQVYNEFNLLHAPTTPSQLGEAINAFISKEHLIFKQVEKVLDYEQCAQYYHRNGYLVNEYVNAIDNIFDYVQNRFYFNVLKMSLPEVHLVGVIEDSNTISLIVDRLEAGIRLWNVLPTTFTRTAQYHYNHTSTGQRQLLQLTYWDFEIPANYTLKGKTVTNVTANTTPVATSVHNYNFNSNTGALSYSTRATGTFLETTLTSDVYVTYEYIETINPVNLGNFMYDNVELKYIN